MLPDRLLAPCRQHADVRVRGLHRSAGTAVPQQRAARLRPVPRPCLLPDRSARLGAAEGARQHGRQRRSGGAVRCGRPSPPSPGARNARSAGPATAPGRCTCSGARMTDRPTVDLSRIVTANDVRGVADEELTDDVARAFGAAFADFLEAGALIVAHDMRISSPRLAAAFTEGAVLRGSVVAEAGLASTDQLYCASGLHRAAGAMVTASHNPAPDNGFKLCLAGASPVSRASGLDQIRRGAESYLEAGEITAVEGGRAEGLQTLDDYADTLLSLVRPSSRRPLRVAVDAANAMAGLTAPAVFGRLGHLELVPLFFELDGTFPNQDRKSVV